MPDSYKSATSKISSTVTGRNSAGKSKASTSRNKENPSAAKTAFAGRSKQGKRRYWLFKTEPGAYSLDDLANEPTRSTFWDGVRNYQARNFLRDDVQVGDGVLFYHSNCEPPAIVGTADVTQAGYPDHTAFDPKEGHYDPKSKPESPTWYMVDIRFVSSFEQPVTREMLAADPVTKLMGVMQRGSRLSILPVTEEEWKTVLKLANS